MFEVANIDEKLDKETFAAKEPGVREALLDAQFRLRDAKFSVIIVIAGAEGAGKGETVNHLLEWLDTRGVETHALGQPTEEERERPPFYRFWRRLPPKGKIGIFFGSWYTDPVVQRIDGKTDEAEFEAAMHQIVEFERMLVNENTLLLKFWLHITEEQQRKNFKRLEKNRDTAWRVTKQDWKYHKTYAEFADVAARAIHSTSTGHAPWRIINAADKRFRHMTVAEQVSEAIAKRLEVPPAPKPAPEPLPTPRPKNILNSLDLSQALAQDEYDERLPKYQGKLGRLARRMTDEDRSAVLVFEGSDAAGKGGCIRRVVQALDARFYRVVPVAAPTDEERARPYLWRFWRNLPGRGHFTVYDRSWYGRVLVERIEGFCRPEDWQRAFAEINAFEQELVEHGTLVLKFWLTTSPETQLARFKDREATGYKRHKLTDEDWRNRDKWPAYEAAVCDMVERTSTVLAPWTLVEADDKLFARIKVLHTVCEHLEQALGGDARTNGTRRKPHKK